MKQLIWKTMKASLCFLVVMIFSFSLISCAGTDPSVRVKKDFGRDWKFYLGDIENAQLPETDDSQWRQLKLPHDWSIEGEFSKEHPATPGGGALPGGIGWYRKTFTIPETDKEKLFFIDFDGVYKNSEVWINGHYLGKRPYGYISFRYDLTPHLKFGNEKNIIAVKVDNSKQPNSRWYSGSGIYRNVWLVTTNKIHVDNWGTYVTTPEVNKDETKIALEVNVKNFSGKDKAVKIKTRIIDMHGSVVTDALNELTSKNNEVLKVGQNFIVESPKLWSIDDPHLYKAITTIECDGEIIDDYSTAFGIRTFEFNAEKGFILNGKKVKINGVCNHHDLGFLGAAINTRALERQLEIMKEMGVNGLRTSHNPPAPELLDLCDKMGFIVMDEGFDMWKKSKTPFDYGLDFDEWHKRDLEDFILRDRNHPSVFIWSIGNEILEQFDPKDSSGTKITKELAGIVKRLDNTRIITAGCNHTDVTNPLLTSGVMELIGYNYHQNEFIDVPKRYPGLPFIATESVSALMTRGFYDMPSDSIRRWPIRWDIPFTTGNKDLTCSSYDNVSAPWGSTHEETWKVIKKHDFIAGQFIWTGFDYLGEPTPYSWPARSSYFGIVDLAGFPKDIFYMYKGEWTNEPVLHLFPHWNWKTGQTIDMWVYTNQDEVELFINGKSHGIKSKKGDDLHLMWRVVYEPGSVKAVSKKNGKVSLVKEIHTASSPYKIELIADRQIIKADGNDLSFITVNVLDEKGNLVPNADNLVNFTVSGDGIIAGVDNGLQTSLESFKMNFRKAFNGKCLVVVQSTEKAGTIKLTASSKGLKETSVVISTK